MTDQISSQPYVQQQQQGQQYQQFNGQNMQPQYPVQGMQYQQAPIQYPYVPQAVGYQNQAPQGIVIVQDQYMTLPSNLNNFIGPTLFKCPQCHQQGISNTIHEPGSGTYLGAFLLCCLFCPAGIIPFVVKDCQDRRQLCPGCGFQVGFHEYRVC